MAKSIKNKQYTEFWEDEKLDVQKTEKENSEKVSSEEIKKLEKKINKKVTDLKKEIKQLKDEPEEIQPVNKPRGWHAKNEFIDDEGNIFSKGKYVGKVEEPKDEELPWEKEDRTEEDIQKLKDIASEVKAPPVENAKKQLTPKLAEKMKKAADNVIPDLSKTEVKSDERKMEIPKQIPDLSKLKPKPLRKIVTEKDIYQQYIDDRIPFKMYHRGTLIFDSKIQPARNYPVFNDDGFILFGKNYIYRGIRIEKY
jgi:hypothetical protein